MSNADSAYVAMILPDADTAPDAVFFLKSARRALLRHDAGSGVPPKVSTPRLRTAADTLDLRVSLSQTDAASLRVVLTALPYKAAPFCPDDAARVLAEATLDVIDMAEVLCVEWNDPDSLIEPENFSDLRRHISPKRTAPRKATPPPPSVEPPTGVRHQKRAPNQDCDADARRLIRRFMEEVPDSDMPHRADLPPNSAPARKQQDRSTSQDRPTQDLVQVDSATDGSVAIRLAGGMFRLLARGFGRLRAVNFRMATHVLTVSALFAILHSTDRLNGVLSTIWH